MANVYGIELVGNSMIIGANIERDDKFPVAGSETPGQLFFKTDEDLLYVRNSNNTKWTHITTNIDVFRSQMTDDVSYNGTLVHDDGTGNLTTINLNSQYLPYETTYKDGILGNINNVRDAIDTVYSISQTPNIDLALNDLTDVNAYPNSGDFLQYVNGEWVASENKGAVSSVSDNQDGIYIHDDGEGNQSVIDTNKAINDITDVDTAGFENGKVLTFHNNKWIPQEVNSAVSVLTDNGDGTYTHDNGEGLNIIINTNKSIDDITDVNASNASDGQTLIYSGTNWIATDFPDSGVRNWLICHNGEDFVTAPVARSVNSIALGESAQANQSSAIAIGTSALSNGTNTIAIGFGATTNSGTGSIAIGKGAKVQDTGVILGAGIAIGPNAVAGFDATNGSSICIASKLSDFIAPPGNIVLSTMAAAALKVTEGGLFYTSGDGGINWKLFGTLEEAPIDGTPYVRQDADWISITEGGIGGDVFSAVVDQDYDGEDSAPQNINEFDFTGHAHADGTALSIIPNDVTFFEIGDERWSWIGPVPVTVGVGGNHTVTSANLVRMNPEGEEESIFLDDLADVDVVDAEDGKYLGFNSKTGNWEARVPELGDEPIHWLWANDGMEYSNIPSANGTGFAIGDNAISNNDGIAMGNRSQSHGLEGISLGHDATTDGTGAIAIGNNADAPNAGIAIGYQAETPSLHGIAIGNNAMCNDISTTDRPIVIGEGATISNGSNTRILLKTLTGALQVKSDGTLELSDDGGSTWNPIVTDTNPEITITEDTILNVGTNGDYAQLHEAFRRIKERPIATGLVEADGNGTLRSPIYIIEMEAETHTLNSEIGYGNLRLEGITAQVQIKGENAIISNGNANALEFLSCNVVKLDEITLDAVTIVAQSNSYVTIGNTGSITTNSHIVCKNGSVLKAFINDVVDGTNFRVDAFDGAYVYISNPPGLTIDNTQTVIWADSGSKIIFDCDVTFNDVDSGGAVKQIKVERNSELLFKRNVTINGTQTWPFFNVINGNSTISIIGTLTNNSPGSLSDIRLNTISPDGSAIWVADGSSEYQKFDNPIPTVEEAPEDGTLYARQDASWVTAPTSYNWTQCNNGADFTTAPTGTGTNSISIGNNSVANNSYGIAIGNNAQSTNESAISIGDATSSFLHGISIGTGAKSKDDTGIAIGKDAAGVTGTSILLRTDAGSVRIKTDGTLELSSNGGTNWNTIPVPIPNWTNCNADVDFTIPPSASTERSIAIGENANASGLWDAIAIGSSASSSTNSLAIGVSATADGTSSVTLGDNATTSNINDVAIGSNSKVLPNHGDSVSIGHAAESLGVKSTQIGFFATSGEYGVAIGSNATATTNSIALGHSSTVQNDYGIVIGKFNDGGLSSNKIVLRTDNAALRVGSNGELETSGDGGVNWSSVGGTSTIISDDTLNASNFPDGTKWFQPSTGVEYIKYTDSDGDQIWMQPVSCGSNGSGTDGIQFGDDNEKPGAKISVVATLPGTPDENTIYLVTG